MDIRIFHNRIASATGGGRTHTMDTKKYEALVTAVEQGSFTKAASLLGYTQSGLTHMMNALETEIGIQLLQRGHFGTKLTTNGERLMPLIEEFLQAGNRLSEEIAAINSLENDVITVGAYPFIAQHWLPTILQLFGAECPGVQVRLQEADRQMIHTGVLSGRFDLGFTSAPQDSALDYLPLRQEPLVALLPKAAFPAQTTAFPAAQFEGQHFLMPPLGCEAEILALLARCHVQPEIERVSVSSQAVVSMVGHSLGVSILPRICVRGHESSIRTLPLSPQLSCSLGIVLQKKRRPKPALQKLIACARAAMAQLCS